MLDGDLDDFMEASLSQRAFGTTPGAVEDVGQEAMTKVAFIGLGRMGHGMAGRYLDAGFSVAVWNRSRAKAEDLIARGARWGDLARKMPRSTLTPW